MTVNFCVYLILYIASISNEKQHTALCDLLGYNWNEFLKGQCHQHFYLGFMCSFQHWIMYDRLLVWDRLYTHPCVPGVCPVVSVLRFLNSQRNLYWGQPGARYWSAAQYKQLTRCTQTTKCCSAWPKLKFCTKVPDSCSISRACYTINNWDFIFYLLNIHHGTLTIRWPRIIKDEIRPDGFKDEKWET